MRAVVQRVKKASVKIDGMIKAEIGDGLLVFLGVGSTDAEEDARYLVDKIVNLRIFEDQNGKMNLSALETGKELMIVSQFTLYGDCRKGRRPNFTSAASPDKAEELYQFFLDTAQKSGLKGEKGQFQAMMDVELINDGPVTLLLDSRKEF